MGWNARNIFSENILHEIRAIGQVSLIGNGKQWVSITLKRADKIEICCQILCLGIKVAVLIYIKFYISLMFMSKQ